MITKVDRVIVTGSRKFKNEPFVHMILDALLDAFGPITIAHGGCPTGADHYAATWCQERWAATEVVYPADWDTHGKAAGPIRNQKMVADGADILVAFLEAGTTNAGTVNCIGHARRAGIPIKTYTLGE